MRLLRPLLFSLTTVLVVACHRDEPVAPPPAPAAKPAAVAPQPPPPPPPPAKVAVAVTAVDAGEADLEENDFPPRPFSAQELLAEVAKDCEYDPGELGGRWAEDSNERTDFNPDYFCGPNLMQNCDPDPCFDKTEECNDDCGKRCDTCKEGCLSGCQKCKASCEKDASGEKCRLACASTCLSCRKTCVTEDVACQKKVCVPAADKCGAEARENCKPICAKYKDCMAHNAACETEGYWLCSAYCPKP